MRPTEPQDSEEPWLRNTVLEQLLVVKKLGCYFLALKCMVAKFPYRFVTSSKMCQK
jgi:hypothetical protein